VFFKRPTIVVPTKSYKNSWLTECALSRMTCVEKVGVAMATQIFGWDWKVPSKLPVLCLHCGTRYLIAVLAHPTAQVPRWAGSVSGGPGSIPGRFWRTGVPSFRRCSAEPLYSGSVKYRDVVRPLHRPLHYRVRGRGRLKNKKKIFFAVSRAFNNGVVESTVGTVLIFWLFYG